MNSDEIRVAQPAPGRASRGLSVLVVVLACVAAASLGYLLRERERASLLSTDNQEMSANLAQMRARLETLTSKVDDLASQRTSESQAVASLRHPARQQRIEPPCSKGGPDAARKIID